MEKTTLLNLLLLFIVVGSAIADTESSQHYVFLQKKVTLSHPNNLLPHRLHWINGEILFKLDELQSISGDMSKNVSILTHLSGKFDLSNVTPLLSVRAQSVVGQIYRARIPFGTNTLQAVVSLAADPAVAWAEPVYAYYTDAIFPNDPDFSQQWHLHNIGQTGGTIDADIDAPEAWQITTGEPNVVLAVIDTGVDWDHPDLADNIWINQGEWGQGKESNGIDDDQNGFVDDYHGWDFVTVEASSVFPGEDPDPPDNDPMDFHGHGTHCAGIASAVGNNAVGVSGVTWACKIMPVRAGYKRPDGKGVLQSDDIVSAMNYAVDNGANIISMSFSGLHSEAAATAVQYAFSQGVMLVAGAGNTGSNAKGYPAGYDEVFAVAATDANDAASWFTTWGSWVDVAAPGVDIYSTYFDNSYDTFSGTSMACPLVAGTGALCLSQTPGLTNVRLAQVLRSTCDPVNATRYVGLGRVNAAAAVNKWSISTALLAPSLDDSVAEPPLEIYGTADGESYILSVGEGPYPAIWTTISTGGRVIDGILGTWDMAGVGPGDLYSVRLVVDDQLPQRAEDRALFWSKTHFTDIEATLENVCFSSVTWGDYDNDGDLDLAVAGQNQNLHIITKIYKNNAGIFADIHANLTAVSAGSLAWADYDNDGDLDLAIAGGFAGIYRNDGNDVFTGMRANLPPVGEGASIAWGDYDNDGDQDLALAGGYLSHTYHRVAKIFRNDGSDVFTDIQAGLIGVGSCSLAWGDYDNDSDLDLAVAGSLGGGQTISKIYRNENGTFIDIAAQLIGVRYCALAWADYDNDGDLDLALAGDTGGSATYGTPVTKVYRNEGSDIFTDNGARMEGLLECSLGWGDYDNDGEIDLVIAGDPIGWCNPVSKIYRNNGDGTFSDIGPTLIPVSISSVCWGDYDNDGDLDLALAGSTIGPGLFNPVCKIYRNDEGFPANTRPAAPTGLSAFVKGTEVTFSWKAATDAQTPTQGLSYNLRIGTTSNGDEVFSGMAGPDGLRLLPAVGNAQQRLSWTINDLKPRDYYWSAQAIDTAFAGSPWAAEQTLRWLYVDAAATGAGNGRSWTDTYNYLQDALGSAQAGDQIWVAEGTYKPDANTLHPGGTGDPTATFQLINSVQIHGGYAGVGEADPNARHIDTYKTMLSGDIGLPDINTDNSYHVVTGSFTDATAVLDGFTITSGNADGGSGDDRGGGMYNDTGSPMVTNCIFSGNSADYIGGGMYNYHGSPTLTTCMFSGNTAYRNGGGMKNSQSSRPTLTNCIFSGNSAAFDGGGMHNFHGSDPTLINCTFTGNLAGFHGGAMFNHLSSPMLTGCTLSSNAANEDGGGIYNAGGDPRLTNCILWGNRDSSGTNEYAQIHGGTPVANYCTIQGWTGILGGTGNIGDNPAFMDADGLDDIIGTEDDNLRLSTVSPCIDAGDNNSVSSDTADLDSDGNTTEPTPWDLDRHARVVDGDCNSTDIIDMGAYEFAYTYIGDFDGECDVDMVDFAIFALAWLTESGDTEWNPACDISIPADNSVDMLDLAVVVEHWLAGIK